jgi:hypothetical protein
MAGTTPQPRWPTGIGFGRGDADSFAQRRLAAEQRLSSSRRMTELVESALGRLDEQLAAHGVQDVGGSLRATARSALLVAYEVPEYDMAIAPARGRIAVRITHSEFGLEVRVVELGARTQPSAPQPPAPPPP